MEVLRAAILGIVQGLTEFLPVSSSGHLEIAKYLLGEHAVGEESLMLTIVLHAATALGTLYVFRKDVGEILRDIFTKPWNEGQEYALKIVISMIPAAIAGFLLESEIAGLFGGHLLFVGMMLLITAGLLFFADQRKGTGRQVTRWDALWIGISQMIAILPGISRSGATISASLLLGIDRYKAARFSFLMVVPLILGKIAFDILKGEVLETSMSPAALGIGFAAACVSGVLACRWMVQLVTRSKLRWFAWYCVFAGLFTILIARFVHV